jgi:hypothetical protein
MLSRKIVTWWCAFRARLPEMSESVSPSLVVVVVAAADVPDDQVDPRLQRDRQRRARRRQSVTSGTT